MRLICTVLLLVCTAAVSFGGRLPVESPRRPGPVEMPVPPVEMPVKPVETRTPSVDPVTLTRTPHTVTPSVKMPVPPVEMPVPPVEMPTKPVETRGPPVDPVTLTRTLRTVTPPQPKIVNGDDAAPGAWPHQVQLLRDGAHQCGGSLLHSCYVLTAAHCVENVATDRLQVVLGQHNLLTSSPLTTTHSVISITLHPTVDVALLLITPSADLTNERIDTISLATSDPGVGTLATVTGWGRTNGANSGSGATVLQEVTVPIADRAVCTASLPGTVQNHEICAGANSGPYANACHGDSGGPLVVETGPDTYELVGVVSWGVGNCPLNQHYAVYASVAFVRDWILNHLPTTTPPAGASCNCVHPAIRHDGTPVPATYDGANCYLGPARVGCANDDEETKSFIYNNRYYIKSSAAVLCPAGTFDSCNCHISPKPAGGFVYNNKFYLSMPPSGICPPGTTHDGANCFIMSAPWATNAFIYGNSFYTTPRKQCAEPAEFDFDGANCRYTHTPGPNPFIWNNGYYCDRVGGVCPTGSTWDLAHCHYRSAPWATNAFLWGGWFYSSTRRQCYEGAFDGANCLMMHPPAGHTAFIHNNNYYYSL